MMDLRHFNPCEEGETELDQEFMDKYHVVTETIEEESELNQRVLP